MPYGFSAMDIRISVYKLDVLCRAVEFGSVTRAAASLGVAQPVVTGHIRSLEERLGVKLFARSGRSLRLTEAGEVAYAWAHDVVARTREAEVVLDSMAGVARDGITLAACSSSSTYLLPDVVLRFGQQEPAAHVQMRALTTELAVRSVFEGSSDFAIVSYLDGLFELPDVAVEHLREEDLVLVASPDHPLEDGPVPAAALADLTFICTPGGSARRHVLDRQLADLGVPSRRIAIELGHSEPIKTAVRRGVGVALLARVSVAPELAAGTLREIPIADAVFSFRFDLITRRDARLTRLQRELIRAIRDEVAVPAA